MEDVRIINSIKKYAEISPDSPAVMDTKGHIITYKRLYENVNSMSQNLSSRGITINQRIAVVIDNGLKMAIAYLAVSNVATFVPLGSSFSEDQYRYYFKLLKTNTLLIQQNYDGPLKKLAEELNINIIYLQEQKEHDEIVYNLAGGVEEENISELVPAKNDDIASVNYTSGTTSMPKIVPRSHINSYYGILKRLKDFPMSDKDRVLIITPMDRNVALNMLLTALSSGGYAICADSFEPGGLFHILEEMQPTWFSSSPVVLQSIVDYAEKNNIKNINSTLRFIRSSGAPLSEAMTNRIENIFNVPVYLNYGLTETGNIASTQNSPQGYKPGSVGVPSNIDLAIMNERGETLGNNNVGEIAVRGPQIIKRYDNEDKVNKESFFGQWFRTGDSGYLDDDGYLYLTGRIKEIINRGGEKVSPYEVEDAISTHQDVLQAVVFPIPVAGGNEDVGAAVVLREGSSLYLKELRRFLNGKIVAFKMPIRLYIMQEIPFSEAGKIQRKSLYEKITALNIHPQPEANVNEIIQMPRNESQAKLYKIYKRILPLKKISITDTFFELGGDSLRAALLFTEIRKTFNLQIPLKYIFSNGTIEALAEYIDGNQASNNLYPFIVPFQEEGSKTPIFFIHAAEGESVIYRHIAINFDPERPFYGINFNPEAGKWEHPITFEQIARHYLKDIRTIQPQGPYVIAGHCVGGIIAYEMARQLKETNQEVSFLVIFDSIIPGTNEIADMKSKMQRNMHEINRKGIKKYLATKWFYYRIRLLNYLYAKSSNSLRPLVFRFMDKNSLIKYSRNTYQIKEYAGNIIIIKPEQYNNASSISIDIWSKYVDNVRIISLQGNHNSIFYEENAENTKAVLRELLTDIG